MIRPADIIKLVGLGAIWGSSFIFMRIACPILGAFVVTDLRVVLAALAMSSFCYITGLAIDWRSNWRHFLIVGLTNSAIPYFLFAFAALYIPAGYSAMLNATSPLFGAMLAVYWLNDRLTYRKVIALALGFSGVGIVSIHSAITMTTISVVAMVGCLVASLCYAIVALYIKKRALAVPAAVLAAGSLSTTGLFMLPIALYNRPPLSAITSISLVSVFVLGMACTGFAQFIYYQLIKSIGPAKALTVTFLIPVFGILWAALFLGECVTAHMIIGCALIISGTYLVVRA
jgi:drug/metabolite transporter (DMT)-like permease